MTSMSLNQQSRALLVEYMRTMDKEPAMLKPTGRSRRHRRENNSSTTQGSGFSYDTNDLLDLHLLSLDSLEESVNAFIAAKKNKSVVASNKAISDLPRARILPMHKEAFEQDDSECSICCKRLIDGLQLTRLPCGHVFHFNCVGTWLSKSSNACPTCRYELDTGDRLVDKQRDQRMKARKLLTCSCRPGGHTCFFADSNKCLSEQFFASS